MSLRADALSAAADKAAAEQARQAAAWQNTVEQVTGWFRQRFAVDAVYLDTVTYSDSVFRDRYTHHVAAVNGTKYMRWQVDDVVFLVVASYSSAVEQLYLEGVCKQCGLPAKAGYGIHAPAPSRISQLSKSRGTTEDDERRADLVAQISSHLGPVVCKMCEANLPRRCDHCQRSL